MSTGYPTVADDPREIDSETAIDVAFLEGLDEQIVAIGTEVVEQRARTFVACYPKADPDEAALAAGTVVALRASAGPEGEVLMVAATAAAVAAGAVPCGLLTAATAPGSRGRVAVGGMVPASVSGLAAGADVYVRANTTTGVAERCALLSPTDVGLGLASPDGAVVIQPVERASFQPFVMMRLNVSGAVTIASIRGMDAADVTVTWFGTGEFSVELATGFPDIVYPRLTLLGGADLSYSIEFISVRKVNIYTFAAGVAADCNISLEFA